MAARWLAGAVLAFVLAFPAPSPAQETLDPERPVVMRADIVHHDQRNDVTTASGSVEFAHRDHVLQADTVIYDGPADLVTASGNVVMIDPDGQIMFSDHAEVTGDLREGVILGVRMLLTDGARLAANSARRTEGRTTRMGRAVYSPCEPCAADPGRAPLWQVRASSVVHDRVTRNIVYRNATLELFGIPVAWTPWLSQPDPSVERRSGFLAPGYSSNRALGYHVRIPYYFDLAPDRDATLAPIISLEREAVLTGEYRALTQTGSYALDGSATYTDARDNTDALAEGKEARWHIRGSGLWHPDPDWQYGFDLYRSSDDTYLSRYGFDDTDTLTSSARLERFDGRSHASVLGHVFQGLRHDDVPGRIPVVAPLIDYSHVTEPDGNGASFTLAANALALTRSDGVDSRRLVARGAWERPFLTDGGHLFTARASLRGDAYHASNVPDSDDRTSTSGFSGRIVPEAMAEWRYLLARGVGTTQQFIEPVVMAVWSPNGGNPDDIPNEDGQDFEFDESNLFSTNRFPGLDRIEGGLRINYGLRMGLHGAGGRYSELFLGQSWRHRDDDTFGPEHGLDGRFSDYVGRVLFNPNRHVDVLYRFRVSRDDSVLRRSELDTRLGSDRWSINLGHVRITDIEDNVVDARDQREQLIAAARFRLLDEWTLAANWREDLSGDDTILYGGSLTYEDECFVFSVRGTRLRTDDVDTDPETQFFMTLRLKTLGDLVSVPVLAP